ncbi:MAG: hypothetical protein QM736_11770 [Vicinamibacterales bacterium]
MTYDRRRLDEAINKMTGGGLKPSEIITQGNGSSGPTELKYQAHVSFSTMQEALQNLEKVTNRRKALIWVSEGYDFNPFQESRLGLRAGDSPFLQNQSNVMANTADNGDGTSSQQVDSLVRQQQQSETFSDAELSFELAEITRSANRANTTIYTIDPRGLVRRIGLSDEAGGYDRVGCLRAQVAGQSARAGRGNRWPRRRQHERLRQGAQEHRRGQQRLLRSRLLLEQSRCDEASPQARSEGDPQGCGCLLAEGIRPPRA